MFLWSVSFIIIHMICVYYILFLSCAIEQCKTFICVYIEIVNKRLIFQWMFSAAAIAIYELRQSKNILVFPSNKIVILIKKFQVTLRKEKILETDMFNLNPMIDSLLTRTDRQTHKLYVFIFWGNFILSPNLYLINSFKLINVIIAPICWLIIVILEKFLIYSFREY